MRYIKIGDLTHLYADVEAKVHVHTVTGLSLATRYELTVRAINELGASPIQARFIRASTSGESALHEDRLISYFILSDIQVALLDPQHGYQ